MRCLSSQINDVLNDESVTLDRTITTTLNADGTIMHWSVQWPDVRGECEIRIRTYGAHASAFGSTTTSSCELASLQDNTWQLSGDHPTLINDIMIAAKIHVTVAESDVGTIHQSVLKYSPVLVSTKTTGFAENTDSGNPTDMRTTGSWMWRTSANEGCWYFDEHPSWVFIGTSVDGWEPKPGRTGTYSMVVASDLHDYCSGLTVNVVEVTSETVDSEKILASSSEANEEPGFPIPITPTAVAVTTSISIFAILLGYLNVESIRMPLSRWGWVFAVGAVRRKPRDGAYQRGRIMGYLQANPGVHFRALLNALEMSNGHLAHHLRVLEEREQLWKRRAGRRVLIYPSTISKKGITSLSLRPKTWNPSTWRLP